MVCTSGGKARDVVAASPPILSFIFTARFIPSLVAEREKKVGERALLSSSPRANRQTRFQPNLSRAAPLSETRPCPPPPPPCFPASSSVSPFLFFLSLFLFFQADFGRERLAIPRVEYVLVLKSGSFDTLECRLVDPRDDSLSPHSTLGRSGRLNRGAEDGERRGDGRDGRAAARKSCKRASRGGRHEKKACTASAVEESG